MNERTLAAVIFALTYALIVSERVPKMAAALAGGLAIIALRVLDQEEAFAAIDFNVIFLLVGMMVIANILSETGVFQWVAIRSAKLAGGHPMRVLIFLSLVTAFLSAFLDNVTTVVLVVPVTLFVASTLEVSPVPYFISEIMASNIGGTATLIGDPPNILIASAADLDFVAFVLNLTPIVLVLLAAYAATVSLLFRRQLRTRPELRRRVMEMDESQVITDRRLLRIALVVLGLTIIGFLFHGALNYEPATVALIGATVLLVASRYDPHEALRHVEWNTIFFFVGLFMVVGGVEEKGILEDIGQAMADAAGGSSVAATFLVLWMSGALSGVVDNIPYTAAMIPVVEEMSRGVRSTNDVLWWALALGADLGGNLTIIAASANVLVGNMAQRAGYRITFGQFLRYGVLVTCLSLLVVMPYLWLRYLL